MSQRVTQSNPAPKVSVVIPCYKTAHLIARCLDSVFAQSYTDFEVVVINDGSPDTAALEEALIPYAGRVVYIKQENAGPSAARNAGIRHARGKYIACLDSDDTYLPEHLARQVELLERDGLELTYADSLLIKNGVPAGRAFEEDVQHPPITFEKLLKEECALVTSSAVASRQAMIDAGLFDESFRRCEDFDLWLRMSFRGARMDFYRGVGIEHRLLSTGLSADNYLLKLGRLEVFRKLIATLPLSTAQQELVRSLIARTEGNCQVDLMKQYAREGRYTDAVAAAEKAASLLHNRKTRWTAWALRLTPWAVRGYLRARETYLARHRRPREAPAAV